MKITLEIPDNKAAFMMELLQSLPFVKATLAKVALQHRARPATKLADTQTDSGPAFRLDAGQGHRAAAPPKQRSPGPNAWLALAIACGFHHLFCDYYCLENDAGRSSLC